MKQAELYERFVALHQRPNGFVMPNHWDATSALILKDAGFEALGTSSGAFAATLGRLDGAHAVSRDEHIAHATTVARLTGLPINGDLEDGFGADPSDVVATVEAAIAGGLAGIGIEDTTADPNSPIHDFDHAVERIRQAAKAAKGRIVLTGRTDNYLQGRPDLDDIIKRLVAFADVGADVLYAPMPYDLDAIKKIVKAVSPKPVNILVTDNNPCVSVSALQEAGAKRISLGIALFTRVMGDLKNAAGDLAAGDLAKASRGMAFTDVLTLIRNAS